MPCSGHTFMAASMPVHPIELPKAAFAPASVRLQADSLMLTRVRAPASTGSDSNAVVVKYSESCAGSDRLVDLFHRLRDEAKDGEAELRELPCAVPSPVASTHRVVFSHEKTLSPRLHAV
ncbi:hypothetical protein ACFPRL_04390 [Pseudoclavibacter helvolus]